MIPTILILCDTIQQVATNATSSGTGLSNLGSIASIVGVILAILSIIITMDKKGKLKPLHYRWRKIYRESITEDLRKDYLNNKKYLQPYITTTPPQKSHEPKNTKLENKELLRDFFINKVFIKEPVEDNTVFFLFGDSGTGKTAALVHLFIDYIKKHNAFNLPFNIRLISLRREDALNEITNIPKEERKNLILLLDAMDETPEVKDPTQLDSFLNNLKTTFLDFARIVITCRPQFFPDDVRQEIITNPIGIRTSTGFLECSIKYLAPFDNQQIQEYLDQAITFRSEDPRRRKAEEIVNMQPAIAIRPLVLSFIKEIVDADKPVNTTLDLFDTIIYSILKRDIKKSLGQKKLEEKITQWWQASSMVAGYMYQHYKLTITDAELDNILPPDIDKSFKQRSLLTRYKNELHFSHKSFYEYFMAYRFFLHPKEITYITFMDFALKCYDELYNAYKEKHNVLFTEFDKINPEDIAFSLINISFYSYYYDQLTNPEFDFKLTQNYITKYQEGFSLLRQLTKDNPDSHMRTLAIQLEEFAFYIHESGGQYNEAYEEYKEALKYYRILTLQNPKDYLYYMNHTLQGLFRTSLSVKFNEFKVEYDKTINTYNQLAERYPDMYLSDMAQTLFSFGLLFLEKNKISAAEDAVQESLEKYCIMAKKSPDTFDKKVEEAEELLKHIRELKESTK